MTEIVDLAIEREGLRAVLAARRAGTLAPEQLAALRAVDLLALGALADRVRAEEVGEDVRIYVADASGRENGVILLPGERADLTGLELLREVALARVGGPRAARVRVDWTRCGLELAQVSLGFGANELVGRIADKRGLPLAAGDVLGAGKKSALVPASLFKRRELEQFVRSAGRAPHFVQEAG